MSMISRFIVYSTDYSTKIIVLMHILQFREYNTSRKALLLSVKGCNLLHYIGHPIGNIDLCGDELFMTDFTAVLLCEKPEAVSIRLDT